MVSGEVAEYTLQAMNYGPDRARRVRITDLIPEGARVVSATGDPLTVGDSLVWDLGRLEQGADSVRQVRLDFLQEDRYVNEATVTTTSTDPLAMSSPSTKPTKWPGNGVSRRMALASCSDS